MIKRLSFAIAAAAALLAPAAASAQVIKQFSRKDLTVRVEPNLAYVFYRMPGQSAMIFIREPNASDFEVWRAARAIAFEKAMKKYRKSYVTWRASQNYWEQTPERWKKTTPQPIQPVMPTDDNFAFPTIEMSTMTEGLISPAFFKEKPVFGFLIAVPAGTYAIYGSVMNFGGNMLGVCMCMGTVKFEARAGEVVDLGMFGSPEIAPGAKSPRLEPYAKPLATEIRRFDGPLPARLQGLPVRPAEFHAAGKFPNYFGVTIDRLHPMPGVLSYRRDTIIDERTGQPIPSQRGTAR